MENNILHPGQENQLEPKSVWNYAFKWGLIASIIYIVKTYILYYSTDDYSSDTGGIVAKLLDIIIVVACMIMASNEYKTNENGGYLTFGKAFKVSYFTGIITSIILAIFNFVFLSFQVDYDALYSKEIDKAIAKMKEAGMTAEQIAKRIQDTPEFMKSVEFVSVIVIVMGFTIYAIYALISAAITKRKQPDF